MGQPPNIRNATPTAAKPTETPAPRTKALATWLTTPPPAASMGTNAPIAVFPVGRGAPTAVVSSVSTFHQ